MQYDDPICLETFKVGVIHTHRDHVTSLSLGVYAKSGISKIDFFSRGVQVTEIVWIDQQESYLLIARIILLFFGPNPR